MKRLFGMAAVVTVLALAAVTVGGAVTAAQEGEGPFSGFLAKVAEKLGVSEDELKTAIDEAQVETIDEAVAAGQLTEEQAERLKERAQEGPFMFPLGPMHRGPGPAGVTPDAAAEALGIPRDELMDQLRDGKSLAEVAEAQGMSVEDFQAALLAEVKAQLDARVADGDITQEQADDMLERIEENIDDIVSGQLGPCGLGGPRRGPGGFGAPWESPPSDETPESTETTGAAVY